jgi:hypothetical protein
LIFCSGEVGLDVSYCESPGKKRLIEGGEKKAQQPWLRTDAFVRNREKEVVDREIRELE